MSGIVGYIGKKSALPQVIQGMRRLEYRGYDSAGLAWPSSSGIQSAKIVGDISQFEKQLSDLSAGGQLAIGHTRWATHGDVSMHNAHPHFDATNNIAVVHKGIIENYKKLQKWLRNRGHIFYSETDTEVLAHLIGEMYQGSILDATRNALRLVEGSYSIAVVCSTEPDRVIIARKGQPLLIGVGEDELMFASAVEAIIPVTRQVVYLDDNQIADVGYVGYNIYDIGDKVITPEVEVIQKDIESIVDGDNFKHAMLREIYEQPKSLEQVIKGRFARGGKYKIMLAGLEDHLRHLLQYERIIITACGTSWYAGVLGKYILEELLGVSIVLEYASEFRYRDIPLDHSAVLIAVSQSGENPDTLAAMQKARDAGMMTLGITNVPGSTLSRESDCGVYLRVGSQRGLSSTKTFSAEVLVFVLLGLYLTERQGLNIDEKLLRECRLIAEKVETVLLRSKIIEQVADIFVSANNFLFIGQGFALPVILEGGLKLRDLARKHVDFYHGAEYIKDVERLVEPGMPVIAVVNHDQSYDAALRTLQDIHSKGGYIIAIVPENDDKVRELASYVVEVPETMLLLTPLLNIIPLQLLAYHIADKQGIDIDKD